MFLIQLAKGTDDAECLKVLCRKLRKAANVLLHHHEVWIAVYDSYLSVVRKQLHPVIEGRSATRIASTLPKIVLDDNRNVIEQEMFAAVPKPQELLIMQDLYEIKKLNSTFAPENDIDELMLQCYAALFVRFGTDVVLTRLFQERVVGSQNSVDARRYNILDRDDADAANVIAPPITAGTTSNEDFTHGVQHETSSGVVNGIPMTTTNDLLSRVFSVCRTPPVIKV
ncbi:hypothetical protein BC938DRAFT_472282 [Jimgerdemannia flammicorona]|nr:hypothetical protein BC938DRAFT_472282 [Jimgerdemannia flammicorona]